MPQDIATELVALRQHVVALSAALSQHVAALAAAVQDLARAQGMYLTREELRARRGCHRNTLRRLIERGIVPRPDALDHFDLGEILRYEERERCGAMRD